MAAKKDDNTKTPGTLEEMHAMFLEQQATLDEQAKTIASQKTMIDGMKMKETVITTVKKKKIPIPAKTVKIDGKEYKWTVPHFILKTVKMTAEDAALDEDVLKEILAIKGQGILKELA